MPLGAYIMIVFGIFIAWIVFIFDVTLDCEECPKYIKILNICAITFIIFSLIAFYKVETANVIWEENPYSTEHIIALNDGSQIHGHFYLTGGHIDEDLYYQYIVDLGNGGYVANKVKASNAIIYYDNSNYYELPLEK